MTAKPPSFARCRPARLEDSGFSPEARDALLDLEQAFYQWHRQVQKGELTGRLLAASGLDLEPALFHGLTAIVRIETGVGRAGPAQATVGLVAEEMAIDPSRASRIVTELIKRDYVARAAAQEDGRKSVLQLTAKAEAAFAQIRDLKWQRLVEVFSGWSDEDIRDFARLFGRYVAAVAPSCGE